MNSCERTASQPWYPSSGAPENNQQQQMLPQRQSRFNMGPAGSAGDTAFCFCETCLLPLTAPPRHTPLHHPSDTHPASLRPLSSHSIRHPTPPPSSSHSHNPRTPKILISMPRKKYRTPTPPQRCTHVITILGTAQLVLRRFGTEIWV